MIGIGDYGARVVRYWAEFYAENLILPSIEHGHHVKTKSLIHDEDVRARCRAYLKSQKPDKRTVHAFKRWIHDNLLPEILGERR